MNINLLKDSSELIFYNNPLIPIFIVKGILSSFSNLEALCHWHEDVEFLMPIKGHISYNVNGTNILIEENEAIFINSRQMHYGYSADGADCEYICIVFNAKSIYSIPSIQKQYIDPIIDSSLTELKLNDSIPSQKQLLELIRNLYDIFVENTSTNTLETISILYQIWRSLLLSTEPVISKISTYDDINLLILKRMLSFIYDNFDAKISLSDIADSGSVCRSKCFKLFKIYLNKTPNEFLNSYRLEKSIILLRDNHISISEIAYTCGFSSSSYFSETFLKFKGCTPSDFRVKMK